MMRAKIRRKGKRYTSCSVFQPTLSPDVQLCVLYVSHSITEWNTSVLHVCTKCNMKTVLLAGMKLLLLIPICDL